MSDERGTVAPDAAAENDGGTGAPDVTVRNDGVTGPPDTVAGVVSEDQVKLALRRVKDPDLNLNIVDLGLVYGIVVEGTTVKIDMTLTSPACPSGPELMTNAETEVKSVPGVEKVEVNLVWAPFWTPEKMEPRVRAYLGF